MPNTSQTDLVDYDLLVQSALRTVIRTILSQTQMLGLLGDQHFYITFVTTHPKVKLSEELYQDYPDEMTIVLQYEFWDLTVFEDAFKVTLNFDDIPEEIYVPFDAVTHFADPSVKFGIQFKPSFPEDYAQEPLISQDNFDHDQQETQIKVNQEPTNNVVMFDFSKKNK